MQVEMADHGTSDVVRPPGIGQSHGLSIQDSLTQTILRASVKDCNDPRNRFVPRTALIHVITQESVARLLQASVQHEVDVEGCGNVAQSICPSPGNCPCKLGHCTGGRMIVAALLLCGRPDLIKDFLYLREPRICDASLPFSLGSLDDFDHGLDDDEKELFIHMQWLVYTPFLTKTRTDEGQTGLFERFPEEVSLPWKSKSRLGDQHPGEVTYVERIEVYAGNHDLSTDQAFALKTFDKRTVYGLSEEKFLQEVQATHDAPRNERIVRLLTAFTYRGRYYLLFPLATEGSLEKVWRSYTPVDLARPEMTTIVADWYSDEWLIGECLGIAEALVATHGPANVRPEERIGLLHADIKAENVLCFRDSIQISSASTVGMVLKLADFGEAKRVDPNVPLLSSKVAHVKTYRPPENSKGNSITLNYDVWCLGCLFLDFITWALLGQEGVDLFSRTREDEQDDPSVTKNPGQIIESIFFKRVKQKRSTSLRVSARLAWGRDKTLQVEAEQATTRYSLWAARRANVAIQLKDAVNSHMQLLHQHRRCSHRLGKVLSLIGEKMLVVNAAKRASSCEVRDFLRTIATSR